MRCCTRWRTRTGERSWGSCAPIRPAREKLAEAIPIARPGVSRHLRVLREAGLVEVRQEAQRRIYSLRPEALIGVDEWLSEYRVLWQSRLDALHTEIARGKKARK